MGSRRRLPIDFGWFARSRIEPCFEMWFASHVRLSLIRISSFFPIVCFGWCFVSLSSAQTDTAIPGVPTVSPLPPSATPLAEEELIRPVFQPGNTYRFINKTQVSMELPGKGIREAVIEMQARFDAKVRADGKDGVELLGRTERLKVDMRSGGKVIQYDSRKPEDQTSLMGKHFRASLNRSVEMILNEEFRIISAKEKGSAGSATPMPGLPQYGPEELKHLVHQIQQGFSKDPVKPGDEWVLKGQRSVGDLGKLSFDMTYRHAGQVRYDGNNCILFECSGRLGGDVALPAGENSVFSKGKMDIEGTVLRGRILFDPLQRTLRLNEQTLAMLLEIPGKSGEAPVQVPMEQRATIRLLHVVPTSQ